MNVVRRADDLGFAERAPFCFKESPVQPARGVDLRSRGEMRLEIRPVLDQEFMSGFSECERQRLAALPGNRLA